MVVDLNGEVVGSPTAVNAKDPSAAQNFIPDRVRPGSATSWLMAEALLKSWNTPAIVTEAEIARQHAAAAQPKPHFYEIVPKKSVDSRN
jgi:hypothetical protein